MQTIGERLEEARKKKGISIREAAEATKIRGDYLQRFESNHFDIGLTEIYTRGFLRSYANFLKIPADRILNDYAALGRSEARPRQPSREVYGRMDISVATAAEPDPRTAPRAAPAEDTTAAPEPSPANRGPQRPRPGSSLPTGLDPALVFKYVKWGGIALIAIVAVAVIWNLFSGGESSSASNAIATAPRGPSFGLVSSAPVQVTVRQEQADGSEGAVLFSGMVSPGETEVVPRPGPVFIEVNAAEHLQIEINGRRHGMGLGNGYQRGRLPAP